MKCVQKYFNSLTKNFDHEEHILLENLSMLYLEVPLIHVMLKLLDYYSALFNRESPNIVKIS